MSLYLVTSTFYLAGYNSEDDYTENAGAGQGVG